MIWRLVAAQSWRIRWHLLILLVSGAMGAIGNGESAVYSRLAMGYPLMSAVSAIMGLGLFWSRDVRVLPIARRTALRAAWLAALVLPGVILIGRALATVTQLAVGATVTLGVEAIVLAAICDTAYIGTIVTLMQRSETPWQGVREAFSSLRESGKLLLGMFWMVAAPFAGPELVPTSATGITWLHVVGVLVCIVITAWPLVTTPDQWPRLGILHDAPRATTSQPVRRERAPRAIDRLTGMRRILPGPVATSAIVAASTLALSMGLTVSLRNVQSPFAAGLKDLEFFLIGGPFFLLILGPFGWANGLTPFLRGLRTLPVSAMRIVVTMTMLALMIPVFFWVLATGVHLVFAVSDDTAWRLESFALLCGVMAFSGAVHARFNSMLVAMIGWFAAVVGAMLMLEVFDEVALESVIAVGFPIVGLVGVSAAFLLNYRTVTRGSSSSPIYRPAPGASLYRGGHV